MKNDKVENNLDYKKSLNDLISMMNSHKVIDGDNLFLMIDVLTDIVNNDDSDSLNSLSSSYHKYIDNEYAGYVPKDQLYNKAHNNLIYLSHLADYKEIADEPKKKNINYLVNILKKDSKLGNIKKGEVYSYIIKNMK